MLKDGIEVGTSIGTSFRDESVVDSLGGEAGAARLEVLAPFIPRGESGTMTVRIETPAPILFSYQANWLYDPIYRISPDHFVVTDGTRRRRVRLAATERETRRPLDRYWVNAYGLGFVVPAGEHVIDLAFGLSPHRD